MKKILIISAMADVELNYLIENLHEKQIIESKLCKFYKGKIYENEIILCDSKVGLINNAAATTLAIEKFNPDYIINQGCAGAISRNIHKSDIVIRNRLYKHNINKYKIQRRGRRIQLR